MAAKSTYGLCSQRLAKLLDAGSANEAAHCQLPAPQAAAQLLQQRLASPLDVDKNYVDSVSAILDRSCQHLQPISGRPLGDVLLDPTTPLAILETLKEYGKGLSHRWDEGTEHVVAATIYLAAIAAALVSHRCKITTRSYRDLADLLRLLMNDQWITPELAGLFNGARTICEEHKL